MLENKTDKDMVERFGLKWQFENVALLKGDISLVLSVSTLFLASAIDLAETSIEINCDSGLLRANVMV